MSNSTPAGWYPDPEHGQGGGPARERYWDGGAWTAQYRPAGAPPAPAAPFADAATQAWQAQGPTVSDASPAYGHPAVPAPMPAPAQPPGYGFPQAYPTAPTQFPQAYPPPGSYGAPYLPQSPSSGRRPGLIVGILAGALLLIAATVGVVLVAHKDSAAGASAAPPAPAASQPAAAGSPDPSSSPTGDSTIRKAPVGPDGSLQDTVHGWSVPLPAGWTNMEHDASNTLVMITHPYTCTMPGGCVRGNFAVGADPVTGPDARTVAEQGMAQTAPQLFGDLTSHQALTSGPVTVAGLSGYAVRWHVVPTTGAKGYLLVVAVPIGGGFATIVGSVDEDPSAPPPAALDQIVSGIRAGGAAGTV